MHQTSCVAGIHLQYDMAHCMVFFFTIAGGAENGGCILRMMMPFATSTPLAEEVPIMINRAHSMKAPVVPCPL